MLGALIRRHGDRDSLVIATKGCHPPEGEQYKRPAAFLSAEVIERDVSESLERLGVDRIDLYYLHRDDGQTPVEEIMGSLNEQVRRGRLRYLAASNWSTARIDAANEAAARHGWGGFVASQVQFSLATPGWKPGPDPTVRYMDEPTMMWHRAGGLPQICYSSTANGFFARNPKVEPWYGRGANFGRRDRVEDLAVRLGTTPTRVALAWLAHQGFTVIPIIGTTNPDHLADALGATELVLSAEQARWLTAGW
jgi:aryl-alcohol dehydrogenase-like predicted oxidoreductase